ncbi:MAG TPA: EVE domain-containing protein, partial [Roseiflexaceae bacterium]|nr:EVE domain-containing protein [Roseiflexaceae bacterium]
ARDNLARPQLAAFIANAEFDEGAKAIRRAYQRSENNLLNAWDRLPLENAPNEELVRSLFDLLYGDDPFDERFARWIELLSRDKPNCWPAATFFLMLLEPERHMFVKPGPFRTLQIRLRPELSWTTRPTAEAYQAILDMSRDLFEHLQPLGARDMIDVQSFVWIIQPEHERAWIFQSNPKYYDLGGALATLEQFAWSARQRASDMRVGDTVYLWEAGDNAGIRAVATITGEPEIMGSDAPDQAFYLDLAQFKPSDRQVPLRVERVLSRTLTRAELLQHPQLSKLQIIVQPNATNYKVSENDAVALESLTAQIPDVPKGLRMPLEQPPRPLDGPAFVVVDSVDGQSQVTDQTFSFTTYSVGERPKLLDALRAFQSGGPPVYLLVYRPSPRYAFTAWARVRSVHEEQGSRPDNPNTMRWTLALDQHEFPVPLKLKTNAERLTSRIPWLANGLMAAFQGYSIRQIEPAQFHLIVSEAHKAAITPPDPDRPEWKPEIYAGQDAQFWRIHFPRDMWPDAYQHHTIGIGFDENPTDQSVKRFLRIKPG